MSDAGSGRGVRGSDVFKDAAFGEFERHTTGFGSKMLAKFGFQGRLGKHEDGILNPIQASGGQKRSGLAAMGELAGGPPRKQARTEPSEEAKPSAVTAEQLARRVRPVHEKIRLSSEPGAAAQPPASSSSGSGSSKPLLAEFKGSAASSDDIPRMDQSPVKAVILHSSCLTLNGASLHHAAWMDTLRQYAGCSSEAGCGEACDGVWAALQQADTSFTAHLCDEEALTWHLGDVRNALLANGIATHTEAVNSLLASAAAVLSDSGDADDDQRALVEQLTAAKDVRYFALCMPDGDSGESLLRPVPGLRELIARLKQRCAWKVGVLHAGERARAAFDLEHSGLKGVPSETVNARGFAGRRRRPYLALYIELVGRLQTATSHCLAVATLPFEVLAAGLAVALAGLPAQLYRCLGPHHILRLPESKDNDRAKQAAADVAAAASTAGAGSADAASSATPAARAAVCSHEDLASGLLALFRDRARLARPETASLAAGDACVAVFSEDGRPYAASVTAVQTDAKAGAGDRKSAGSSAAAAAFSVSAAQTTVSVTYTQYGNSESLPGTEVLLLVPQTS